MPLFIVIIPYQIRRNTMNLTQAITEQWNERFPQDQNYADSQIKKVQECEHINELFYHCMNVDIDGHSIIAQKLKMSQRDFAFLLSSFRALDQNHIYKGGTNGFPYKEERIENADTVTIKTTYPDETVSEMCFTKSLPR